MLASREDAMIRIAKRIRHWFGPLLALACMINMTPFPALAQDAGAHLTEITRGALRPPSTVKYTDDLDGLLARHTVRVLVVPNLTNYFIDRGSEHGLTYESFILFGSFLERTSRSTAETARSVTVRQVRGPESSGGLHTGAARSDLSGAH